MGTKPTKKGVGTTKETNNQANREIMRSLPSHESTTVHFLGRVGC